MPIYEYECKKCGRLLEAFQKFSDAPLKKCKECSGKLQKFISHSTFHLKGTGWYVTDYANKSGGSTPASEGKAKKSASDGEAKKTSPGKSKASGPASSD